ncbi:hypothetical protein CYLTODRAFT_460225 [Cylindrobasidium torrendii FP15055 ss-10]|uniref:Uncharacterized protein n=1 Tax=Cylindrobasidium torrendii FP15055 ss-10 TaxID=1314674 RepID=A0A0D7AS02_9AGAR|nr:hypothetical protein CYLTODRAFT_460225 [Cylindrobasidium torrendii FP15055 ss-10]
MAGGIRAYLARISYAELESTPTVESEENGAPPAHPSPMESMPQPVESSISQQSAELPSSHSPPSANSQNDAVKVDISADIHIPEATTALQERSVDPASSEADSMKLEVSSMPISYPTPSSSWSGPSSSNSFHTYASSKSTPSEEIKEGTKQEDEMSAFAVLAAPKEEDAVTLKQEDNVMVTRTLNSPAEATLAGLYYLCWLALPSAASISPSNSASPFFVPRIKTQEAIPPNSMSLDSPTRTTSPQPMPPAPEKLDATSAPDRERRTSPARIQAEANGALVTATSPPAADAPNQSLELPELDMEPRTYTTTTTSVPVAASASAHVPRTPRPGSPGRSLEMSDEEDQNERHTKQRVASSYASLFTRPRKLAFEREDDVLRLDKEEIPSRAVDLRVIEDEQPAEARESAKESRCLVRNLGDRTDPPIVGIRSAPRALVPHLDLLVFIGIRPPSEIRY